MKRLLPPLLVLAVLGLGICGYLGWRSYSARLTWDRLRPPTPPPLGATAPGLDSRIAAYAERIQSWPPDRAALAEFSQLCHANGHLESAAAAYDALITFEPTEPRWPHRLAAIVAGYGRLDEALPLLRRATELAPDYVVAWLRLGDALLKSNAVEDAKSAYQEVLRREPENRYALIGLARCELLSDRLTAARGLLQRAVAGLTDFAGAQSLLAVVYDRLGNPAAAELARGRVQRSGHYTEPPDPWMEELLRHCHDPYKLLTAASAATVEDRLDRAQELLERGLSLAPNDARLRRQLGKNLAIARDYVGSRRELERAVQLDPKNDGMRLDLLAVLRRTGDDAAFERQVVTGVEETPESAGLQYEAGRIAARAGRLEAAIQHLEKSWKLGPDQSAPGLGLADVYLQAGRNDDAIALLEEILVRFPKEYDALIALIKHGTATADRRTAQWLRRAIEGGAPNSLLAELRQDYEKQFGPLPQ